MKAGTGRIGLLVIALTALVLIASVLLVQSESSSDGANSLAPDAVSGRELADQRVGALRAPQEVRVSPQPGDGGRVAEATAASDEAIRVGASLFVRVVDDASGEPVPNTLLTLLSERPSTKSYGTAVTDKNGRASFTGLTENLYVVRSMRRSPHAEGLTAVWLPAWEHAEATLRLGTGGSLTGRVVDDTGSPLEGVPVNANPGRTVAFGWSWVSPERMALEKRDAVLTDSDGRFRLDAMTSEAQGIWIVDGEVRPERFEKAGVVVKLDGAQRFAKAYAKPGETVDVGDIVVDRLRTWRGRVVEESGAPVPGALLTTNYIRSRSTSRNLTEERRAILALAPGQPGFALEERETLTDGAGRFELSLRIRPGYAFVRTVEGRVERVRFPILGPGELREGVELVLELNTRLSIELVDEAGEPIVDAHPEVSRQELQFGSYGGSTVAFRLSVPASADSPEDWESSGGRGSPEGLYHPTFDTEPAAMGELLVFAPGYRSGRLRDAASAIATPVQLQLETLPSIRLSIRVDEAWPNHRFAELRRRTELIVSSLSPHASPQVESRRELRYSLGSKRELKLGVVPIQAHMFVREPGEYWAYLVPSWPDQEEFAVLDVFGPFTSHDERVNEVVVSSEVLELLVTVVEEEESKLPPPPDLVPGGQAPDSEPLNTGRVTAILLDSVTGEAASGVRLTLMSGEDNHWLPRADSKRAGHVGQGGVPAGKWRAKALHWNYEEWESQEFIVEAGGEVDLGTILLVPHPRLVGKLLEADGTPVPVRSSISLHSAEGAGQTGAGTVAEGAFDMPIATTERVHALFFTSVETRFFARRLSQFRCTSLTELGDEIVLEAWREVEFVLDNLLDSERHLSSNLYLEATTCGTASHHAPRIGELSAIGPQLDGRRVFRGRLGVGTYIPRAEDGSLGVRADPFEVVAGEGLQRVQLSPAR